MAFAGKQKMNRLIRKDWYRNGFSDTNCLFLFTLSSDPNPNGQLNFIYMTSFSNALVWKNCFTQLKQMNTEHIRAKAVLSTRLELQTHYQSTKS